MLDFTLIGRGISYLFPAGRTVKLVMDSINLTNSSNPLVLAKNVTMIVVDCCSSSPLQLGIHCIAVGSLVDASVINPNPLTIGSGIHIVSEIYEDC